MLVSSAVRSAAAVVSATTKCAVAATTSTTTTTRSKASMPKCDFVPAPHTGLSKQEVKDLRKRYLSPALFHYYTDPFYAVQGHGQYLYDENGKQHLDFFGGIVTISAGHCHPKVTKAGIDQMKKLVHTTSIYMTEPIAAYAKELTDKLPGDLSVVYFTSSGSEANDLAFLMARTFTNSWEMLSLRNGYHGMSLGMMGVTSLQSWKFNTPQGFGVRHCQLPDMYRGRHADAPNAAELYAQDIKEVIQHSTPGNVAGFIAETIQGVGGSVCLPPGYLEHAYKHVRAAGGVCIADEVQSGFGRLGSHYWGFETQNVMPDIVTMAKGIGNGAPLAAVVTTPAIAETMSRRLHFNTYGGNPVSSEIGRAVLKVIDEENLQQNCKERGDQLLAGMRKLQEKYECIGDVRGAGLMLGMELVKDRKTKVPDPETTNAVFNRTRELGLLLGKGGLYGNVFRIKPPMGITKEDCQFSLQVMDEAFSECT